MKEKSRSTFSGNIGFVLAAAGSAVGLGNIWRFPYLAAKDGGGLFLLVYLILVLTFGFALLTTEIAIGRKTGQGPLTAYGLINPKGKFIGVLACIVPAIILPYYCTIGGWVLKYFTLFITGSGKNAVADGYFTGFITGQWAPIIFGVVYLLITAAVVIGGVNKGIERFSKVLMPILVVLSIGTALVGGWLIAAFTDIIPVSRYIYGLQALFQEWYVWYGLIKSIVFAFIIASTASFYGCLLYTSPSPRDA